MRQFLRLLYLFINAIAVVALFCCILTRYINPDTFPIFELFGLVFPIIFIINICTSIVWVLAKDHKRNFLFSFIPVLLSIPTAINYYSFGEEKMSTSQDKITVLSYNVMDFNYLGWRKKDSIQEQVFNFIKKENPDIICFQEFQHDTEDKNSILFKLKKQLKIKYSHYNKTYIKNSRYSIGNIICSRYPIVNQGCLQYQKQGNCTIWADIAKDGDTIRVYSNHLESYRLSKENKEVIQGDSVNERKFKNLIFKLFRAMKKRGVQADELVESIKECPYPVMLCGDFNAPACSYVYKHLRNAGKFSDAFMEAGHGIGTTYNWWPHLRLDYILCDKNFDCNSFIRRKLGYSDHYPISCTIELKK